MSVRRVLIFMTVALLATSLPSFAGDIHKAIQDGDVEQVRELLAKNPLLANEPDKGDEYHSLPLHLAATSGHVDIARLLIDAGAVVDGFDSDESTPLQVAAMSRHQDMVLFLMAKGADINRRDKNGAYSMSFAASSGDSAIVQLLIDAEADLNFLTSQGMTLMHYAASRGQMKLFDHLLENGRSIDVATIEGVTPLHFAANGTRVDMVERLLDLGMNPSVADSTGHTPLHNAAYRGRTEVAKVLIAHGAEVDAVAENGVTPLLAACRHDDAELARLLLKHDVNVSQVDRWGRSALTSAVDSGNVELTQALVEAGADINQTEGHWGYTPLHQATIKGYGDVVKILLAAGADVNALDQAGNTPGTLALRYGHTDIAKRLAMKGGKARKLDGGGDCGLAARNNLKDHGAVVWYLEHSAWAIQTQNHTLIFDYSSRDREADQPSLCNGTINPAELAGEHVTVFASHEHGDHFDPAIFEWREEVPNINYVLGCHAEGIDGYEYVEGRTKRMIDGVKVMTIESNDSGVAFVVEVDGLVIYHAGDHANRLRDFSGPYIAEIDYLADRGVKPDIAFMPISGCNFGDLVAVKMGVHYALDSLDPRVFIPMHGGSGGWRYAEFIEDAAAKHPDVQMVGFEHKGDHFRFGDGKMQLTASTGAD